MWKGVTGSLGPWGGGGIAGMVVGSQWRSWAARVYRAAVMMWSACPSRTMWRSVPKSFGRWAAGWTVMWARARWWAFFPPSGACVRLSPGMCWCWCFGGGGPRARDSTPCAIAMIRKDRSKAVLVVPMGCTEEESTRHWVVSLTNMTLNNVVLPAGESVYQDAEGQPMPPERWPTEFHYVDGGLDQADTTDFVCVNRIVAEPWRQCFAVSPVDIGESEDPLTEEELDLVQGYMDQPFHDWGSQREGKGQDKAWWKVDSIVSGSYDGDTFVRRVLDYMSSQDEPIGGKSPTYGDLFRGKTRDGPLGHLGRPPEPKPSGVATPQVSSVVQVPGKAKAESDDCPKIQALRARLKQKYGDTFFSRKPVFPPPVLDRMVRPRYD